MAATGPYGKGNFPTLKEGDVLTAAQLRLISSALQKASAPREGAASDALAFTCDPDSCVCVGEDDCNDMFTGQSCGPDAVCLSDGAGTLVCICLPA